jgi:iron complex outermembrane recepter protein
MCSAGDSITPVAFPMPYFTTNYTNQFVQDEVVLVEDRLTFTLGCKLEQNPFTGLEYEPNVRLLYTPDRKHAAWGAISRSVRTPGRVERQIQETLPPIAPDVYPRLTGSSAVGAEDMFSYELGYRAQTTEQFSWDVAAYYNVYNHLDTQVMGTPIPSPPPVIVPVFMTSQAAADACGIELSGNYAVSERWRLYAQYSVFEMMSLRNDPLGFYQNNDPNNQICLRSSWDLRENVDFDMMARYVDALAGPTARFVPSYITMDLRLAWRPKKHLEVALVGQNLLQAHHLEYNGYPFSSQNEVPRSVYSTLTWRY